jgi:formylglycine-generating enzyme required for sulfatase activity
MPGNRTRQQRNLSLARIVIMRKRFFQAEWLVSVTGLALAAALLARTDVTPNADDTAVQQDERELVLDLGRGVTLEMVRIQAGSFLMGSPRAEKRRFEDEGPQHPVEITHDFYLGKYEVTQQQYQQVMGYNPSFFSAQGEGKDEVRGLDTCRFPAEEVSWNNAVRFCRKLSATAPPGWALRLPTEAEWEYACRAGTVTPFHFGRELNGKQANCDGRRPYGTAREGPYLGRPTPVGSYPPNAWGLYDMHGNVWEHCADWYGLYSGEAVHDPQGPGQNENRLARGGGWLSEASDCRAALRSGGKPGEGGWMSGFRIALSPR